MQKHMEEALLDDATSIATLKSSKVSSRVFLNGILSSNPLSENFLRKNGITRGGSAAGKRGETSLSRARETERLRESERTGGKDRKQEKEARFLRRQLYAKLKHSVHYTTVTIKMQFTVQLSFEYLYSYSETAKRLTKNMDSFAGLFDVFYIPAKRKK